MPREALTQRQGEKGVHPSMTGKTKCYSKGICGEIIIMARREMSPGRGEIPSKERKMDHFVIEKFGEKKRRKPLRKEREYFRRNSGGRGPGRHASKAPLLCGENCCDSTRKERRKKNMHLACEGERRGGRNVSGRASLFSGFCSCWGKRENEYAVRFMPKGGKERRTGTVTVEEKRQGEGKRIPGL